MHCWGARTVHIMHTALACLPDTLEEFYGECRSLSGPAYFNEAKLVDFGCLDSDTPTHTLSLFLL